jgi:hypothetical protein
VLLIHDSAPPAIASAALAEDVSSPILSVATRVVGPLPFSVQSEVDQMFIFGTPVPIALKSIDCSSSAFLEYYARKRGVPFGRLTGQECLGLVGHSDRPDEASFGPGSGLVELSKPLAAELGRKTQNLIVVMGGSSLPLDIVLGDVMLRFGAQGVNLVKIFVEDIGQLRPSVRLERPLIGSPVQFSPVAVLLILACYLAGMKAAEGQGGLGVNIARLTAWALASGLSVFIPAKRGLGRARPGLSDALRSKAASLVEEGLLTVYTKKRPGPRWQFYSLTRLGSSYAQILLQLSPYLKDENAQHLLEAEVVERAKRDVDSYSE